MTTHPPHRLSRRDFIKMALAGFGGLALQPWYGLPWTGPAGRGPLANRSLPLPDFPAADRLGRASKGTLEIKARPDPDSQTVGILYEDEVRPWLSELTGVQPTLVFNNQRWVEIPEGYVYGAFFQPVRNQPNVPVQNLPQTSLGPGMWVEVTVPYVDASLQTTPTSNSWVEALVGQGLPVRAYYSQTFWVDTIRTDDQGQMQYRINPNYYGGVDMLWAAAEAFRPLTAEDIAPIHPDAADKRIQVDVTHQTLVCLEGAAEAYFCRVATGAKYDMYGNIVDKWATPVGEHWTSRKFISLQMSGGTTGAGYDLPGIGWTVIFATGGVAIHSTFWHNNYGDTMSHGCVNVSPEDAKWIWRWSQPVVSLDPGMVDVTQTGQVGTKVIVKEI